MTSSLTSKKKITKEPLKTFTSDLERELTAKEKEQLQRRSDLRLAKELFGMLKYVKYKSLNNERFLCVFKKRNRNF